MSYWVLLGYVGQGRVHAELWGFSCKMNGLVRLQCICLFSISLLFKPHVQTSRRQMHSSPLYLHMHTKIQIVKLMRKLHIIYSVYQPRHQKICNSIIRNSRSSTYKVDPLRSSAISSFLTTGLYLVDDQTFLVTPC